VRVSLVAHRRRCRPCLLNSGLVNKSLGQLTGIDDTGDAQRTPEGAPPLR
jgi:hypothetical protein